MNHKLAAAVILATLPTLSACEHLRAQSRVNPRTIAIYSPTRLKDSGSGEHEKASDDQCVVRPIGEVTGYKTKFRTVRDKSGAIDLNCFKFPEDRLKAGQIDNNKDHELAYVKAVNSNDNIYRNRLTDILLKYSDDTCTVEL